MRNKGLFLFFSILIALTCLYCLSFSFVSWKIGKDARNFANDPAVIEEVVKQAGGDKMLEQHLRDSVVSARETQYLADKSDQKVFLGETFKKVQGKEIKLGLDLRGGMNVLLEIYYPDVVKGLADNTDELFDSSFEKAEVEYAKSRGNFVTIFRNMFNEEKQAMNMPNASLYTYFGEKLGTKTRSDDEIASLLNKRSDDVLSTVSGVISARIDKFGVLQANIQELQGGRILVELPGVKETDRVTDLLKSTAKLEFWEVYNDVVNGQTIQQRFAVADGLLVEELKMKLSAKGSDDDSTETAVTEETNTPEAAVDGILARAEVVAPNGAIPVAYFKESQMKEIDLLLPDITRLMSDRNIVLMWGKPDNDKSNLYPLIPLKRKNDKFGPLLSSETINGERVVKNAKQDVDQNNRIVVNMSMDSKATEEWRKITKAAVDNKNIKMTAIAIVLDDFIYSYPTVQSEIPNGQSVISGSFSIEEAKILATVLNSGNLDARVDIVQSEVVGPTLGKESINAGLISFALAFSLVLLYMFLYYGRAGFVADIALLTNVFFLMGVLASLGAVLTLPGIAGIVLTMGMAIDANVLIYERIREEVRAGKGMRLAVNEGYQNAYSAIFDGQITTLITGIVLYYFGSGPIKGFATTLIIGIITSLFTAIVITRLILEREISKGKEHKFGNKYTLHLFSNTKFDFIKTRKFFYPFTLVLVAITFISFFTLKLEPGVEFTGGRNYVIRFDQDIKTNEIRDAVTAEFGGNPIVKTFGSNSQVRITTNYKIDEKDPAVDKECAEKLYNALKGFYVKSEITLLDFTEQQDPRGIQSLQIVQPSVAKELLRDAVWAVLISLVLIFLYIAIRFKNWEFGIGGVVGLAHDALLTIGLFSLLHKIMPFSMEVDQSFIAAILTVIGYSINNVVIIYDRIRENVSLYPKREIYQNINDSVNQTLGRTVNTSGTTIIVLLIIFIFGGEVIRGFIFAMMSGILIGTYSGLFISAPLAYDLLSRRDRKGKRVKKAKVELLK
ncbi:MAG TPA: protein translocase subunit SecDF [Bacteroidales bacterium]|nr:protein translocase subunit SecDF [Bacteroidales bacterium]